MEVELRCVSAVVLGRQVAESTERSGADNENNGAFRKGLCVPVQGQSGVGRQIGCLLTVYDSAAWLRYLNQSV